MMGLGLDMEGWLPFMLDESYPIYPMIARERLTYDRWTERAGRVAGSTGVINACGRVS